MISSNKSFIIGKKNFNLPKIALFLVIMIIGCIVFAGAASAATANNVQTTIQKNTSHTTTTANYPDPKNLRTGKSYYGSHAIQKAINEARSGDTIYLQHGTFYEHTLIINKRLTIKAPSNKATIDAQMLGRVFHIHSTVTLINLNLIHGKADNGGQVDDGEYINGLPGRPGGSIWNDGVLTLKYCRIMYNYAGNGGNAIADGYGGNGGVGGAIYNKGTLNIQTCIIKYNKAGNAGKGGHGYGGHGGGIYNSGTCTISKSWITYNQAGNGGYSDYIGSNGGYGGGIVNKYRINITNSYIKYNNAGNGGNSIMGFYGNGGWYGGLWRSSPTTMGAGTIIVSNHAGLAGSDGFGGYGQPGQYDNY